MPTKAEWDARFSAWGSPPSQTEQNKSDNAVRAVRAAIEASPALVALGVSVFPQGSYRNRTNVRAESDVDVCAYCPNPFFYDVPAGTTPSQFQIGPPACTFAQYRANVGAALVSHFGARSVRAGSKAFEIHENTNRIAADAVPVFEYRGYQFALPPVLGTGFESQGRLIVNYPEQHYNNGVAKNKATGRRFKVIARILKRLRYEMEGAGFATASNVASFELESMVWNVPLDRFGVISSPLLAALWPSTGVREPLKAVMEYLYAGLASDQACAGWKEVNGIKPLFGSGQPWTREGARAFLVNAWAYAELDQ